MSICAFWKISDIDIWYAIRTVLGIFFIAIGLYVSFSKGLPPQSQEIDTSLSDSRFISGLTLFALGITYLTYNISERNHKQLLTAISRSNQNPVTSEVKQNQILSNTETPLVETDNHKKIEQHQLIITAQGVFYTVAAIIWAMLIFAYTTGHPYLTLVLLIFAVIISIKFYCSMQNLKKLCPDIS
jgi:hypothetical protein